MSATPLGRLGIIIAFVAVVALAMGVSAASVATGHPHDDETPDAILRLLGEADKALAGAALTLRKSPELAVEGAPMSPVRGSIERTLGEMRTLRRVIHVAFEEPTIHQDSQALKSVEKVARELARMSVSLQNMTAQAALVTKRKR